MASLAPAERRRFPRLRPRILVTLAVSQGEHVPPVFGIVSDVSENGMRIHTDRILAREQKLRLGIRVPAEPELFEILGRARWTRPAHRGENGMAGGGLAGVELGPRSEEAFTALRRVLITSDFVRLEDGSQPFEQFLQALRPFLLRLGLLMDRAARDDREEHPNDGPS